MNKSKKILVVEDEQDIQELVRYNLSKEGYHVTCVDNGEEGLAVARDLLPDVIVLDLMLPGIDGLSVCRELKADAATKDILILMLTARGEESDIVIGLEMGADDYVTKPFSPRVVLARLKALLRRKTQEIPGDDEVLALCGIALNPGRHEVKVKNKKIELTATEFRFLQVMMKRPGWVYTRAKIVEMIRGGNYPVTDRSVDVVVVGLRKKLKSKGPCIETVRGVGYRFQECNG